MRSRVTTQNGTPHNSIHNSPLIWVPGMSVTVISISGQLMTTLVYKQYAISTHARSPALTRSAHDEATTAPVTCVRYVSRTSRWTRPGETCCSIAGAQPLTRELSPQRRCGVVGCLFLSVKRSGDPSTLEPFLGCFFLRLSSSPARARRACERSRRASSARVSQKHR